MMKKLLSLSALFLCSLAAWAQTFTVGKIKYNVTSTENLTVEVTSGGSYTGVIVIPEKVTYEGKEYYVTSIGNKAFYGYNRLTEVTIPNSVTSIGENAFHGCNRLTSITIPNSVTTIGGSAFAHCSGLTSVAIPNSVTNIGDMAFYGCSGLTEVTIPNSVTSIGSGAFYDCSRLTSLNIDCATIESWFSTYANINANIKEVAIGENVTSIGENAFHGCNRLTSITIPNSVTTIGSSAFSGCTGLTSVTIPNSVTSIGDWAFSDCTGLTSIEVESGNTIYDSRDNCNAIIETSTNTLIAGCKNAIIPNSVTSIGKTAFCGCGGLTEVTIPNSVTTIGSSAFSGCTGLTSVTIPNSVTTIGSSAFSRCTGLTSVTIPNSVTSIGDWAFSDCTGLTSVSIPNSVTSIGSYAFDCCSGLTSIEVEIGNTVYDSRDNCNAIIETNSNTLIVGCLNTTIPNSVTSIGKNAFYGCSGLTSVTIPNSVNTIENCAFYNCRGLTSVTIPNSVTSIGKAAFCGCRGLTSVTIPNSVTSIGEAAFDGCSGLTSVSIPNSVTSIGSYAFDGCKGLTSVTIPNSVTSIGEYAFFGCSGLTEIYSMISEPFEIDNYCWRDVNKDIPLFVPAGCKAKYEATPGWNEFTNIVEIKEAAELEPVDESDSTDYGNGNIDDTTELNGNVVGNIYYNIADENGAYSSSEGCIVLKKPTTDSSVDGTDIFGEEFKNNFTGIIFKVHAGSGTIKVNAEAIGNMILKVKVGNNAPLSIELQGKMKASFPYTASEESYVYIYGGESSAAAKGTRAADTESVLKIYGIEWSETYEPSGIESLNNGSEAKTVIYNLNGQRVNNPSRGIYIVNGRKVIVK